MNNDRLNIEKLELLAGDRPKAPGKAAVRREDLAQLNNITRKARHLSASPTADDFNDLVDDITTLIETLTRR